MGFGIPEPVYESRLSQGWRKKVCLVCGTAKAATVLRTICEEIIPICKKCSTEYLIFETLLLKKIKPKKLIFNIIKFKLRHIFSVQSWRKICKDLKVFSNWYKRNDAIEKAYEKARAYRKGLKG